MSIDLNMLKYIRTVYECGSISKAAQELYISQPYLSQSIKKFEQETGVLLFDRSSHPMKITPAGMCFVQWCRSIEVGELNTVNRARLLANGPQNVLTVISSRLRNITVLPPVIHQLQSLAPDCRVILKTATSVDKRTAVLIAHDADVLLDMRPHAVSSDLVSREIGREKLLLAIPYSHPLAPKNGENTAVRLDSFAGHSFVSCQSEMRYYEILVDLCTKNGFYPKIVLEAPDIPSCCAAVAEGIGVSVVPDVIARSNLFNDHMLLCPIIGQEDTLPVYLTYYRELESTQLFPVFLRLLIEAFSNG